MEEEEDEVDCGAVCLRDLVGLRLRVCQSPGFCRRTLERIAREIAKALIVCVDSEGLVVVEVMGRAAMNLSRRW